MVISHSFLYVYQRVHPLRQQWFEEHLPCLKQDTSTIPSGFIKHGWEKSPLSHGGLVRWENHGSYMDDSPAMFDGTLGWKARRCFQEQKTWLAKQLKSSSAEWQPLCCGNMGGSWFELDDGNIGKPGNIWKRTMVSMVSGRFSQHIHSSQEFGHVADARPAGRTNFTQGDGE